MHTQPRQNHPISVSIKRMKKPLSIVAIILAATMAARSELCGKCEGRSFHVDAGKCVECQGESSSIWLKLCQRCSIKLGQCENCRSEVKINPQPGPQGIQGKVSKLKGDFMPRIGSPEPGRNSTTPLAVPVHVFKGKLKAFEKPDPKHPALVKIVQSDKNGEYQLVLPPGEYTVVAEINGKLYLNAFDGEGRWSSVTVKADQWTRQIIDDTSEAAF